MQRHNVCAGVESVWNVCMQAVMAALNEEAAGQGPSRRPHVPGLIDAALVPLQTLMHHCWSQVITYLFSCY